MSLRKSLRKVFKVAAIAVAAYYTGGAALQMMRRSGVSPQAAGTFVGAAGATLLTRSTSQPPQIYTAPYDPGFSYQNPGGAPFDMGAGGQVWGGGGAAVPIMQSGESRPPGFAISPTMAMAGIGLAVLLGGMFLLRR